MARTKHNGMGFGAAAGIAAAAAAAAAGAYFLYGTDGAKHRKTVKAWGLRMKADILERLEGMDRVGEKEYHALIDRVASRYRAHATGAELAGVVRELKGHWAGISRKKRTPAKRKKAAR